MLKKFVKIFGGDPSSKKVQRFAEYALAINALEDEYERLTDAQLAAKTSAFRLRLAQGETLDDLLVEAFATGREASKRAIGLRHYDIQLVAGAALQLGEIAEARTGEGKTLVSTLPIYLNALALNEEWIELAGEKWGSDPARWDFDQKKLNGTPVGAGVHLVTVNDYLARRDARWKAPIYQFLGLDVGVLQMAARTDHGRLAYLIDLTAASPHEDQHQLRTVPRKEAYDADITYGTTNEFGFDYLRDNMKMTMAERVQRGHAFAVIDEVDNVLIDEARTPLIISGPSHDDSEQYLRMAQVVKQLNSDDFDMDERSRSVALTEIGEIHVEQILGETLRDPERPEDITPEQARLMGYLEQGLIAQYVYKRNKDYLVQGGKVVIVDENTGRLMPGRRWSNGLHQAIEAKEGVKVQSENVTYATVTIQNYYRMYKKLCGMTGTAATEAEEFDKIYKLSVLEIPTNLDYQSSRPEWPLQSKQLTDDEGYKYTAYIHPEHGEHPVFFRRKDYPDVIFRTEEAKFRAIGQEILRYHALGRPILVGTTSVELSDRLSSRLKADPIRKLAQALVMRDAWMKANNREADGRAVPELEFLSRPLGMLPAQKMAGMSRELDININPLHSTNVEHLLRILRLPADRLERLTTILKNGVEHQVLNARKHTEESQIIAGAGAFGAVTIATNMAGRGVDIKLGGELAEETLTEVNRILKRAGHLDPYELSLDERVAALQKINPEEYGIYHEQIEAFLKYMHESRQVKELGGLHVIGSERHESRRIDNQLRGRAARQGDPGSSRFYLSMQDELMRLFGGQQAESMMERLKIDEDMPIEMGMVSRIVEQSQTRVEGANFDTRKHLLEYDDVLNNQRATIYSQRDRIMTKDDLTDDINELVLAEVALRVPEALADPEGPWKLLAWVDQTQPTLLFGNLAYASLSIQLLLEEVQRQTTSDPASALAPLLEIASGSINTERDYLLSSIRASLDTTYDRNKEQYEERSEVLDLFMDGITPGDEEDTRTAKDLHQELVALVRAPIKLDARQLRLLEEDPDELTDDIDAQLEKFVVTSAAQRLIAIVERRVGEPLDYTLGDLDMEGWYDFGDNLLAGIEQVYTRRLERFIGEQQDGAIARDIKTGLEQIKRELNANHLLSLLMRIPQGQRASFDRKTRKRVWERTARLTYVHYASQFLEAKTEKDATERILNHMQRAQTILKQGLGLSEFARLGNNSPLEFARPLQRTLERTLGDEVFQRVKASPLRTLDPETAGKIADVLGRHILTGSWRQLLLRVISELWIEYLTQMEALRVSVGLEAYAQRDPLVAYKSKASELFQSLIADTRKGVVSRMFTYRVGVETTGTDAPAPNGDQPPADSTVPADAPFDETDPDAEDSGIALADGEPASSSGKRRRRRK